MRSFLLVFAILGAVVLAACDDDNPTSTPPTLPAVTTGIVTHIGQNSATVNGTLDALGSEGSFWFEFGLDEGYGSSTTELDFFAMPSGPQTINDTLIGLTMETTYHFRLVARNAGGTARGEDATLTTLAPNEPPDTALTAAGSDTVATQVNWHLFWSGMDPDGVVNRYEWRMIDHGADGAIDPADSLGVPWATTAWTDTLFTWTDGLGSRTYFVRAVDDQEARDPTPASRTLEALAP